MAIKARQRILLLVECLSAAARFAEMLGSASYEVKHCSDCETALKLIKTQSYVLVIISNTTKNLDIIAVGSTLKQIRPALKILAVSGYAHRSIIKEAQAKGIVDAFALKTSRDAELLSIITQTVAIKGESIRRTPRPSATVEPAQLQANPDNSLLNDLERRYPGILHGSWAASDTFHEKVRG